MITTIIIVAILTIIAGISKAITDCIAFNYEQSVFSGCILVWDEWNPFKSWEKKYKKDEYGRFVTKNGKKVPKFFLSTTILVFLTDPWHFFDLLRTFCIFAIALLLPAWYIVVGAYVLFHVVFHVFYHRIFRF